MASARYNYDNDRAYAKTTCQDITYEGTRPERELSACDENCGDSQPSQAREMPGPTQHCSRVVHIPLKYRQIGLGKERLQEAGFSDV
jgi:hypothetical protein